MISLKPQVRWMMRKRGERLSAWVWAWLSVCLSWVETQGSKALLWCTPFADTGCRCCNLSGTQYSPHSHTARKTPVTAPYRSPACPYWRNCRKRTPRLIASVSPAYKYKTVRGTACSVSYASGSSTTWLWPQDKRRSVRGFCGLISYSWFCKIEAIKQLTMVRYPLVVWQSH